MNDIPSAGAVMTAPLPSAGPAGAAVEDRLATLIDRLRGHYRIPVRDGLGATGGGEEPENPNEFVRTFQTPPIQHEAAAEIERLRTLTPPPAQPRDAGEVERLRAELSGILHAVEASAWHDRAGEKVKRITFAPSAITRMRAALSAPASPAVGAEAMREAVIRLIDSFVEWADRPGASNTSTAWARAVESLRHQVQFIDTASLPITPTPHDQGAGGAVVRRWPGPGEEPPCWSDWDGTIVYRSYADYCDGEGPMGRRADSRTARPDDHEYKPLVPEQQA